MYRWNKGQAKIPTGLHPLQFGAAALKTEMNESDISKRVQHCALSVRLALTPSTLGGQKSKLRFWYQN